MPTTKLNDNETYAGMMKVIEHDNIYHTRKHLLCPKQLWLENVCEVFSFNSAYSAINAYKICLLPAQPSVKTDTA